jgi:hypothetical protein
VRYLRQLESSLKIWLKRLAISAFVAFLVWLLLPQLTELLGLALGLSISVIALIGYLMLFVGLPFAVWIFAEPIYRVFLKAHVRAWHINRIRNARYLKQAAERGSEEDETRG